MKNNAATKIGLSALGIALVFFITIGLYQITKKTNLINQEIIATELNTMPNIDDEYSKKDITNVLKEYIDYYKAKNINTIILPINNDEGTLISIDGLDYLYTNNDYLSKNNILKVFKSILDKKDMFLFAEIDCNNLSSQEILSYVNSVIDTSSINGIIINNYDVANGFDIFTQISENIKKNKQDVAIVLKSDSAQVIAESINLENINMLIFENSTFEEYLDLKINSQAEKKILLHYSTSDFLTDFYLLNQKNVLDGIVTNFDEDNYSNSLAVLALKNEIIGQQFNFSVSNDFTLTYPEKDISLYASGIFVSGTGMPNEKVNINGVDYDSAKDGTFGIFISLNLGDNILNISQGDTSYTINVTRKSSTGGSSVIQSDGTLSAESGQKVRTINPLTSLITDINNDSSIASGVDEGTILTVVSSHETVRSGKKTYAYKLSNGLYVLAKNVEWLNDTTVQQINSLEVINYENNDININLSAQGMPAYVSNLDDESLIISFIDTNLNFTPQEIDSHFGLISLYNENGNTIFKISFNENNLWGFDVKVNQNDINIYLKNSPKINEKGLPLSNITIMLDAGHGLQDSGALGVAGLQGPNEKHLNLAIALTTQEILEKLGAKVIMTRVDDSFLTLEERRNLIRQEKPDLFISIHHNSMDYTYDSTTVAGAECYYFTSQSKEFANNMVSSISEATNRRNRGAKYSYFYVTRTDIAPSVLMEYSFINNSFEYSKSYSDEDIYKAALGTVTAILNTI